MKKRYAAILMLGLVVWGCATQGPLERDGQAYGVTEGAFRGRWWSYYERGSSYLAGEFLDEARSDLEQAIKGRSRDTWQARTYGLHFVEYFPNRELGVVLYHQGDLDQAARYLQTSLDQIDTDRGHYYLDQVKRAKIAQGEIDDSLRPEILITSLVEAPIVQALPPVPAPVVEEKPEPAPAPVEDKVAEAPVAAEAVAPEPPAEKRVLLCDRDFAIEIKASDDVGVSSVSVNGRELPQRGSAEEVVFKDNLLLTEGVHEVEVAASDLADKGATETVEVTVDLTGPTIGIFAPADPTVTENALTRLDGVTIDKNGVVSVALSERMLAESDGDARMDFTTELPLGSGENSFVLIAKDTAGNETRSAVKVFRGNPDSMAAKLWMIKQKAPHLLAYAANGFPEVFLGAEISLAAAEVNPLAIKLKSPDPERPYRHNRTLRISGDVIAQTKVASLSINGVPFEELTGAPKESFNKRIPIDMEELEDGSAKASVSIAAKDEEGHETVQDFEVSIRPVQMESKESKMPVAVLAFAGSGLDEATTDMLRVTTEAEIFQAERFRVLDRTRLQDVLTEQQLASALADPTQAIQLGKLTNAQVFVVADVFERDAAGLEIKARAISAETSDLLATLDVFVEDKNDSAKIKTGCNALSAQLTDTFPRLSGEILSVRAKGGTSEMLVNWTKEDGVREGMYLLIVEEEDPWIDEDTGEVLAEGEIVEVGKAVIDRVMSSGSKAVTMEAEGAELAEGMAAITM